MLAPSGAVTKICTQAAVFLRREFLRQPHARTRASPNTSSTSTMPNSAERAAARSTAAGVPAMAPAQARRVAIVEIVEHAIDATGHARPRGMPLANSFEAIIGVSVSATNAENTTAAATDTPNSPNSRPVSPCM